ncbi:hypothetical protein NX059_011046 [Plenodomus lindquistii]|nr:hypothetical protein NX059_011046 [Plenodomus lindquistii]
MHSSDAEAGKIFKPARTTATSRFSEVSEIAQTPQILGKSTQRALEEDDVHIINLLHVDPTLQDEEPFYTVAGKKYPMTRAQYIFASQSSGVIITMDRKSPKHAVRGIQPEIQDAELPELQSFSDIAWLQWTRVIGEVGIDGDDWFGPPGYKVSAYADSGAALLGTPNAVASSVLLIQHKARLGNLHIHKITLFNDREGPNMLFHVKPVPEEEVST